MTYGFKSTLIAAALYALLTACQQAETPAEVQEDVSAATEQAETDNALAQAEGDYQIALERCEALAGGEQAACKDEAAAHLEAAQAAAEGPGPS